MLSVLYHEVLVRHGALEEENGVGKVWERDLYLVHLLEVRPLLVNHHNCPDPIICRSNDYSTNLVSSPWKAVLLSYVVVGKCKKFTTDQPTLTQPPAGFDSVWSKLLSSVEIFCDCFVGHWPAQLRRFSELRRTHHLYQRRCASGLPCNVWSLRKNACGMESTRI